MKFISRQFGEFEFEEKHVLHFPQGIIGFEQLHRFLIVDDESTEPFRWLVSLEDRDVSLPLIDPLLVIPDYHAGGHTSGDATLFVVAVLREPIEDSTVNLRSPLVIDNTTGVGRQVILEHTAYALQHPIAPVYAVPVGG